jgi:hypothetical protein
MWNVINLQAHQRLVLCRFTNINREFTTLSLYYLQNLAFVCTILIIPFRFRAIKYPIYFSI